MKDIRQLHPFPHPEPQSTTNTGTAPEDDRTFHESFDDVPIGIFQLDMAGRLLRANRYCRTMLGLQDSDLHDLALSNITHRDDVGRSMHHVAMAANGLLDRYSLEKRYLRPDGSYFWASVSVSAKKDSAGSNTHLTAVIDDISARKSDERRLQADRQTLEAAVLQKNGQLSQTTEVLRKHVSQLSQTKQTMRRLEKRLRTITDNVPVLIGYWNNELRCEFANEAYRSAFGIPPEHILGMHMQEVLGEAGYREAEPYGRRALAGVPQQFERVVTSSTGNSSYLEVRFLPDRESSAGKAGFFVLVTDVTTARNVQIALEAANAKLTNNEWGDYLTGLANRRRLDVTGAEALNSCRLEGGRFGVLLVDLDNFALINAVGGYALGDQLLCEVATILKAQLRNHRDVAARLSGASFALLSFGEVDVELLSVVGENIREQVSRVQVGKSETAPDLTASIGLTVLRVGDDKWETVFGRAVAAVHEAKVGGRNKVFAG